MLTLYTQNVDGLDIAAGIRPSKLVQLHGSFQSATCVDCEIKVAGEAVCDSIRRGEIPRCVKCVHDEQVRTAKTAARREQNGRSLRPRTKLADAERKSVPCGILRPDIVFMDEPPRAYRKRFEKDCGQVDLVIVMGTSLPVEPVSSMPNSVPGHVPQIYIGRDVMPLDVRRKIDFDIQLLGECDVVVEMLAKGCGWGLEHDLLPAQSRISTSPLAGMHHCHNVSREDAMTECKDVKDEPVL